MKESIHLSLMTAEYLNALTVLKVKHVNFTSEVIRTVMNNRLNSKTIFVIEYDFGQIIPKSVSAL